jgi:hypothetical protein
MPFVASRIADVAKATSDSTRFLVAKSRIRATVATRRSAARCGRLRDGNAESASRSTAR